MYDTYASTGTTRMMYPTMAITLASTELCCLESDLELGAEHAREKRFQPGVCDVICTINVEDC